MNGDVGVACFPFKECGWFAWVEAFFEFDVGGVDPAVFSKGGVEWDPAGSGEVYFCPAVCAISWEGVCVCDSGDEFCRDSKGAEHGDVECGDFVANADFVLKDPACVLAYVCGECAEVVCDVVFGPAGKGCDEYEEIVLVACKEGGLS